MHFVYWFGLTAAFLDMIERLGGGLELYFGLFGLERGRGQKGGRSGASQGMLVPSSYRIYFLIITCYFFASGLIRSLNLYVLFEIPFLWAIATGDCAG